MTDHDRSDNIGEEILGKQPNAVLKDEAASQINNLRTQVLLKNLMWSLLYLVKNTSSGTAQWMQRQPSH